MKRLFIPFLALALCSSAEAAGLGPVTSSVPDWNIHRSVDAFNDSIDCTAVNETNRAQIADNGKLYISMRGKGGLKMSRVRYNDSPPHSWRSYSYSEGDIFVLGPSKWQNDQRVSVQIYTVLGDIKDFDFDIKNAKAALAAVKACK